MGYDVDVMDYNLKFRSKKAKDKFFADEEKYLISVGSRQVDEYLCDVVGRNPLFRNIAEVDEETLEITILDYRTRTTKPDCWSKYLNKLIVGEISFQGEYDEDMWKVEFTESGRIIKYVAELTFLKVDTLVDEDKCALQQGKLKGV